MDVFFEVLEQDKEDGKSKYQFKCRQIETSTHLEKVIPDFFSTREPGLHVAIICASSDKGVISEQALGEIIKENYQDVRLKFLSEETLSSQEPCGCIRLPMVDGVGPALQNLEKHIRNCAEGETITDSRAAYEIMRYVFQEEWGEELEITWSRLAAEESSKLLIRGRFYTPAIFALLVIPQNHFELFRRKDVYFPSFIEYVVKGQDSDYIFDIMYKKNPELFQKEIQPADSGEISSITSTIESKDWMSTELFQEKQGLEKKKELEKKRQLLIQQKITSQETHAVSTKDLTATEKARTIHKEEK